MKLTYEQKLKAYQDWKSNLKSPGTIANELHVNRSTVLNFLKSYDLTKSWMKRLDFKPLFEYLLSFSSVLLLFHRDC